MYLNDEIEENETIFSSRNIILFEWDRRAFIYSYMRDQNKLLRLRTHDFLFVLLTKTHSFIEWHTRVNILRCDNSMKQTHEYTQQIMLNSKCSLYREVKGYFIDFNSSFCRVCQLFDVNVKNVNIDGVPV